MGYAMNMLKKLGIFFIFFLSCGCISVFNLATQRNEVILINDAYEVSIGRQVAVSLTKKERLSSDQQAQARVEKIGRMVAAVSDRQNITYEFHVLDNNELNAVSLPGGFIYINSGLLKQLTDDELAFVLGHELGHVAAKHAVKKIQSNMAFDLLMNIALNVSPASQAANAASIARVSGTIYNLVSLGYSRKDEYFADQLGVKYASKAGFSADGAISALEKIKKEEAKSPKVLVYLRTHPFLEDRIAALRKSISGRTYARDTF